MIRTGPDRNPQHTQLIRTDIFMNIWSRNHAVAHFTEAKEVVKYVKGGLRSSRTVHGPVTRT